jgi:hypothetical protein
MHGSSTLHKEVAGKPPPPTMTIVIVQQRPLHAKADVPSYPCREPHGDADGGEDDTPLQVKLNGVTTIIGKIGLAFAMLSCSPSSCSWLGFPRQTTCC